MKVTTVRKLLVRDAFDILNDDAGVRYADSVQLRYNSTGETGSWVLS